LKALLIAYMLMALQIDMSSEIGLTKECLELIGKHTDAVHEIKRDFMRNATRLAVKYLKGNPELIDKMNTLFKKYVLDELVTLLNEQLDLGYMNTPPFKEMLNYYSYQQGMCTSTRHENNIIHKLIAPRQDHQRVSSTKMLLKPDDVRHSPQ
jgi:hypothetical protein